MQSAISRGVYIRILLVLHKSTFFMDDGRGKLMACHIKFLTESLPMPTFNPFIRAKYLFHTFGYLIRAATLESPSRRALCFESLIIKQWLQWYSTQLYLYKRSLGIKAIIYIFPNVMWSLADYNALSNNFIIIVLKIKLMSEIKTLLCLTKKFKGVWNGILMSQNKWMDK